MFERFTERARQAVLLGQEGARYLGHGQVDSEHLLLGLLRQQDGLAAQVLESLRLDFESVRSSVGRAREAAGEVASGELSFTPHALETLELSRREALDLGHDYVGTEHLLLALARERDGGAALSKLDLDLNPDQVRSEVARSLERRKDQARTGSPPQPSLEERVRESDWTVQAGDRWSELGGSTQPAAASAAEPVVRIAEHVIVVASGKGGVGKSTISLNVALALAERGAAVGLLDADVYAPDIPLMINLTRKHHQKGWLMYRNPGLRKVAIEPVERFGLKVMSAGFFLGEDQALSLPATSAYFILNQLANQVDWGELDYLVVDLPPGTADLQQHVVSLLEPSGALIVVTPQDLAHLDAKKVISMFNQADVDVLGGVENMGAMACPHCQQPIEIFPAVAESRAIWSNGLKKLAELPFDPALARSAEQNKPLLAADPEGDHSQLCRQLADTIASAIEGKSRSR